MKGSKMKKVLALINRVDDTKKVLAKALKFLDSDGVLEVLYVHESKLFDLPDFFKPDFVSDDMIDKDEVKKRIKKELDTLGYKKDVAIFVYIEDSKDHILELADPKTFVISAYNEDVTPQLLKDIKNMQLIMKKEDIDYNKIALLIDLDKESHECLKRANNLFEKNKIRVVYDFVYPPEPLVTDAELTGIGVSDPTTYIELSEEIKKGKLDNFYKFLSDEAVDGDFLTSDLEISNDLSEHAKNMSIDLFYICIDEHNIFIEQSQIISLIKKSDTDFILDNITKRDER